ncbi:MAG TPA: ABC transporter permease [Candidatus Saccharimonadales bacterium]|nr:ABC transporter permease [Candidatus Saccharimonadales bacterium]
MKHIWNIAKLDLLLWRRMPMAIAAALIPPLGMTLLLIVLSWSITQQPVALVVQSQSPNALYMKKIFLADDDAYILHQVDKHKAQQLLNNQEVAAVITIPKDFDQKVAQGIAPVDLTLNNVDIDFADDIRRAVDRSVAEFDAPQLGLTGELNENQPNTPLILPSSAGTANPYRIDINEHNLRQTNVNFLSYQVIPAFILLIISLGLMGTALLCAKDIEEKTSRNLILAPIPSWTLVAGRLLGGLLMSIIIVFPILFIAFLFGIIAPPVGHIPALIALFLATGLCASGLGAALGSLLKNAKLVALASSVVATYLFFLGGGFTTIAFLPNWLQNLSALIPIRYAIDGMRQALFYPDLQGVGKDITVLIVTALAFVIVGSLAIRKSWRN